MKSKKNIVLLVLLSFFLLMTNQVFSHDDDQNINMPLKINGKVYSLKKSDLAVHTIIKELELNEIQNNDNDTIIETKLNFCNRIGPTGPTGPIGPTGPTGASGIRELVFTSQDMMRNGASTPNINFTDVYSDTISIRAWDISRSTQNQNPISVQFGVPDDFSTSGTVEVDIHILIDRINGSSGTNATIRLRADFKSNNQTIGTSFEQTVNTGDFTVTEPTGSDLRHVVLTVTLSNSGISPKDWGILVFDRIAPTSDEYNRDIFLATVSFRYDAA